MDYQNQFGAFFQDLANAAAAIALKYFRGALPVDEKDDRSPVTQADREIEEVLRTMIGKSFPDHGIVGEEYGTENADAEFVWVIDPIDGTRAFMTGKPMFGTIIGLLHNNKPVVGLVDQAFTRERWFGIADKIATYNGTPIKVAAPRSLDAARLLVGNPSMFSDVSIAKYLELYKTARWPQVESDCYAYGLLAMGWVDLVVHRQLKIYDVAGVIPIVTGAGGVARDWQGREVSGTDFDGTFIASSSHALADEACALLA